MRGLFIHSCTFGFPTTIISGLAYQCHASFVEILPFGVLEGKNLNTTR